MCAGGVSPAQAIDASADIDRWRARAEQAEAVAARLRQENAGLNARVASLAAEVERLQETVTTLSGLLFGSSSEKRAPAAGGSRAGAGSGQQARPSLPFWLHRHDPGRSCLHLAVL